jgi:mannose-6-phosphate isomerase-like protein (cupin superfamily)
MNYKVGDNDTRPWGKWRVIHTGARFIVKEITVDAGGILSLQRHKYRAEHWIIVSGRGVITLEDDQINAIRDDAFYIPVGAWHRIENNGKEPLVFIEVQTGDKLDENDIERRNDIYGRK